MLCECLFLIRQESKVWSELSFAYSDNSETDECTKRYGRAAETPVTGCRDHKWDEMRLCQAV